MIILDEVKNNELGQWDDPVISLYLKQFREQLSALPLALPSPTTEEDRNRAVLLCDASRQVVYRMHRVPRRQIEEAAELFAQAAEVIVGWKIQDITMQYGLHISERAEMLRKNLK